MTHTPGRIPRLHLRRSRAVNARFTESPTPSAGVPTTKSLPTVDGRWASWDLSLWETESNPMHMTKEPDTVVYFANPRTRQAARKRKEMRGKWLILMAAILTAPLLGILALSISLMTPRIAAPEPSFQKVPTTQPTNISRPRVPAHINKSTLIIQQNPMCWLGGQPGATCNPGIRTYV